MGKKKKKGLSNRLAKMSDEERARYLQHRAAIEEEAKRRKEQLIATYMKNKIKREEAFTRLNTAKINEYWHQILRKIAITNMKSEIQSLSKWIQKVVEIRNTLINKLMAQIDESEKQYQYNFESHTSFIDQFLDMHHRRQEYLRRDFEVKNNELITNARKEMSSLQEISHNELYYLKTIIYALEVNFERDMKQYTNHKTAILEDYFTSFRAEHEDMVAAYVKTMDGLWQEIYETLNNYLEKTAVRRHHYIELKHLDDRNQLEREENEKKINHYQELINTLKANHENFHENSEKQIKLATEERDTLHKQYETLKKKLKIYLAKSEKKLTHMTVCSGNVIKDLTKQVVKGQNIMQIVTCCRRLETEDEKGDNWFALRQKWYELHGLVTEPEKVSVKREKKLKDRPKTAATYSEPDSQMSKMLQSDLSNYSDIKIAELENESDETQPKSNISVKVKGIQKEGFGKDEVIPESDSDKALVKAEEPESSDSDNTLENQPQTSNAFSDFQYLRNLNSLCWVHNRVEMDIIELRKEKATLLAENKRLKGIIRGILEDAVLEPTAPKKPSLRVRPCISSAPASISSSKWARQLPNCVVLQFD